MEEKNNGFNKRKDIKVFKFKFKYYKNIKKYKNFTNTIKRQIFRKKIVIKAFNEHKFKRSRFNTFNTNDTSKVKELFFNKRRYLSGNIKRKKEKLSLTKVTRTFRKIDLKKKIYIRNFREKSIKKNIKKAGRKRYNYYAKMYKALGVTPNVFARATDRYVDDNLGIKSGNFVANIAHSFTRNRAYKNRLKPQKFSNKSFFKQQKNIKLEKKIRYKNKLQTNSRKIDYQRKNFFKKLMQKRSIKKEFGYSLSQRISKFLQETSKKIVFSILKIILPIILFLAVFITLQNSFFGLFQNSASNIISTTTYLSEKDTLLKIEEYYSNKEKVLLDEIYNPYNYHKDYEEINVNYDIVGHNIHNLLSYITAKYGEVKDLKEIQSKLDRLFNLQYKKTTTTDYVVKEFVNEKGERERKRVKRLNITIRSIDLDTLAREVLKDTDNLDHYEVLLETKGNMEEEFKELEETSNFSNVTILGNYGYNVSDGRFPQPNPHHRAKINGGVPGQCTWYVYNRLSQLGITIPHWVMGHGGQWWWYAMKYGYPVSREAKAGRAMSFPITNSAPYGHIAFVEKVNSDGSVVVSEMNIEGEFVINYRTISKERAANCYFIDFGL